MCLIIVSRNVSGGFYLGLMRWVLEKFMDTPRYEGMGGNGTGVVLIGCGGGLARGFN